MKSRVVRCTGIVAMLLLSSSLLAVGQVAVTTYHNDNSRSGLNANETILTPSNVNEVQFGKRLVLPVTGQVYAQPLYVPGVNINGTLHNVVYVVTEHDQAYAFDANTGQQLWQTSFIGTIGGHQTVPVAYQDLEDCYNLEPEIGITSTPVIDLTSNEIYMVAKTKELFGTIYVFYQRMHVLDIRTGVENLSDRYFGAPITATTPGTGTGSQNGYLTFDPRLENQRAALTLSNNLIYVTWGAHCDIQSYHGYVMAFEKGARPDGVYVDTPDAYQGGIWMSGAGPAADSAGFLYVTTGNGYFDVNVGGIDYGDSILRLSWSAALPGVADYFTPWDQATLSSNDRDVSSGAVLLLPDQPGAPYPHLLVQAGKEGTIDLVDRDHMGHFNPAGDTQIVQTLPFATGGVFGGPAMWNNNMYFGGLHSPLEAFHYDPVSQQIQSQYTSATPETFVFPGPTPSVSANGNSNAILWVIETDTFDNGGNAVLRAYNADNLATELYNSNMNQARDQAGLAVKFAVPTVADGMVFVGTQNEVDVYGLLN